MSRQMWTEAVTWATLDGTPIVNVSSEQVIFPAVTIPANYMANGRVVRIKAYGRLSTQTGSAGYFNFYTRWGGTSGVLLAHAQNPTLAASLSNVCWAIEVTIQTRFNGVTGSLFAMGQLSVNLTNNTTYSIVFGSGTWTTPNAMTCDLTVNKDLVLSCHPGAADPARSLTGHIFTIESLN